MEKLLREGRSVCCWASPQSCYEIFNFTELLARFSAGTVFVFLIMSVNSECFRSSKLESMKVCANFVLFLRCCCNQVIYDDFPWSVYAIFNSSELLVRFSADNVFVLLFMSVSSTFFSFLETWIHERLCQFCVRDYLLLYCRNQVTYDDFPSPFTTIYSLRDFQLVMCLCCCLWASIQLFFVPWNLNPWMFVSILCSILFASLLL